MTCPACFAEVVRLADPLLIGQPVDATPEPVAVCRDCFGRYCNIIREATMRAVTRMQTVPGAAASPDAPSATPDPSPPLAAAPTRRRGANGRYEKREAADLRTSPGRDHPGSQARQLGLEPLPMPDATAGVDGDAPVPEFAAGQEIPGTVVTQADVEAMERKLRGETPKDTYSPEDAEVKPWIGGS